MSWSASQFMSGVHYVPKVLMDVMEKYDIKPSSKSNFLDFAIKNHADKDDDNYLSRKELETVALLFLSQDRDSGGGPES